MPLGKTNRKTCNNLMVLLSDCIWSGKGAIMYSVNEILTKNGEHYHKYVQIMTCRPPFPLNNTFSETCTSCACKNIDCLKL